MLKVIYLHSDGSWRLVWILTGEIMTGVEVNMAFSFCSVDMLLVLDAQLCILLLQTAIWKL